MSLMKKYIISLMILIVLCLSSCKKDIKMYVIEDDYNLLNEMLEVPIYCNIKDTPYMEIDNIINIFIYDNDNKLPLEIEQIKYIGNIDGKHQYNFLFNTLTFKEDLIILKQPILEIEYINKVIFSYKLRSVCIYNSQISNDLSLLKIKGICDDYLKGLVLELKNNTCEIIKITDLCLLNAHFGADLSNLELISDYNNISNNVINDIDIYKKPSKLTKEITIKANDSVILFIPIVYLSQIEGNQSGVIIEYKINENIRLKGIHNFIFLNNKDITMGVYDA